MDKPTENKPKWEEQLRLSLYNFKACSPDYNEINIQEIKAFIQEQREEAKKEERDRIRQACPMIQAIHGAEKGGLWLRIDEFTDGRYFRVLPDSILE